MMIQNLTKIFLAVTFTFFSLFAQAASTEIKVQVKGMVCAFCAQGIQKKFDAKDEVESTEVDLDKMTVVLKVKEGKQLPQAEIEKIITESGFQFVGIL